MSMKRISDDGYLILCAYNGWNIHIMKTDKTGEFLWKHDLPSNYVNAVPNLIERNGALYFVCMDAVGLFTYIDRKSTRLNSSHVRTSYAVFCLQKKTIPSGQFH